MTGEEGVPQDGNLQESVEPQTESAPSEEMSLEEATRSDQKPWSRAEKRIKQLVDQKKDAIAQLESERARTAEMARKLQNIESKVEGLASKGKETATGPFDSYSTDDLWAYQAKAMDSNNEEYSPAMATKISQELIRRELDAREQKITSRYDTANRIATENQRVFQEAVGKLPDTMQQALRDPNSPFAKAAEAEYAQIRVQSGGDDAARANPLNQELALLRAASKFRQVEAETKAHRDLEAERQKLKSREALSAAGEAAVEEAASVKNLLRHGRSREAWKHTPIVQGIEEDLKFLRG